MIDIGPAYVPDWIREEVLPSAPVAGEGVHRFLFDLARILMPWRSEDEIDCILHGYAADCGRYVPEREIAAAIRSARPYAWQGSTNGSKGAAAMHNERPYQPHAPVPPRWPPVDQSKLEALCDEGYAVVDLWEASPIRYEDNNSCTEEAIDQLFPGNPWLCCGWSQEHFEARLRSEWRGELSELSLIVPSPMTA
jgi:hypothetical protein